MDLLNHHFVVSKKCTTKFWAIFKFLCSCSFAPKFSYTTSVPPQDFVALDFWYFHPQPTKKNNIQRNLDRHPLVMVNTLQSAYSFSRSVGSLKNFHDLLQAIRHSPFPPKKNQPLPWRVRATYESQCPQRSSQTFFVQRWGSIRIAASCNHAQISDIKYMKNIIRNNFHV